MLANEAPLSLTGGEPAAEAAPAPRVAAVNPQPVDTTSVGGGGIVVDGQEYV